jgi:hypothetical protein
MGHAVIERFRALDSAFHSRASRSERLYARFAALAALKAPQDIECLIERTFDARNHLNEGLGSWRVPNRSMRLVFAAALVASERSASDFFEIRAALIERRIARGGRSLSHGGSCAALALVAAGGVPHQSDNFFDILEVIAAPWWRREPTREEALSAAFTAMGETPDDASSHLNLARERLMTAGVPKNHADAASYEVALLNPDDGQLAGSWTTLNLAVRGRSELRHGVGKTGLAVLAAHGDGQSTADALVRSFDAVRSLSPRANGQTAARLAMRLAQAQCGSSTPIAAASDLSAILAAQAAMIAAVAASSSAAVVAATG